MTDARSIPDAVLWHEGMLLSPQHFQQAEQRADGLRSYVAAAMQPHSWGVRRFRFDEAALIAGRLVITELEAILPDGLLVRHGDSQDEPRLELELQPLLADPVCRRICVHVTAALPSQLGARGGEQQRYRQISGGEVVDQNTGEGGITIARLVPILALQISSGPLVPPPPRFTALPLAVLESDGQRYQSIAFEPPRLRVSTGTLLFAEASAVATELARKATDWGARLSGALADGQSHSVMESLGTLRALVAGLPRLEALLKVEIANPFDVYLALCDVAGHLAVASGRVALPLFPAYTHADPLTAFRHVSGFILDAVSGLRTPNVSVSFERVRAGCFDLPLLDEHVVGGALFIGARVAANQDAAAVRHWFEQAVIGAVTRVDIMLTNAVIGAEREAIGRAAELDLVPPANVVLFRVIADPVFLMPGDVLRISLRPTEGQAEAEELRLYHPAANARSS